MIGGVDLHLNDRVFIVSGGSRGLGFAAAEALVAEGAKVVLIGRTEDTLTAAATALGPENALPLVGDLTDSGLPGRAVASAAGRFGRLDGAMISTGGPPASRASDTTDDAWRAAFESVFLPPLRLARAVAENLTPEAGSQGVRDAAMLIVLSTSVYRPLASLALSNGLRPGLANMVRDLAADWGGSGIRVNGIAPGRIATDRVFALDARSGSPEAVRRKREARIPLGRYGDPVEFGRVAAFLLSPAASYLTGAIIPVDGGATYVD
jgi:3-oxoacyl-[acyl-carrier protein] reductase